MTTLRQLRRIGVTGFWLAVAGGAWNQAHAEWRDASHTAVLRNDSIEATLQAGMLFRLRDLARDKTLVSVAPAQLAAKPRLFGTRGIDLDACAVSQEKSKTSVVTRFVSPDGTELRLAWSIEPGAGDLVLRAGAWTAEPVTSFHVTFAGCDLTSHALVVVDGYGVGEVCRAPWKGAFGDPAAKGYSQSYNHPLVALFQGKDSGWFFEGRDKRLGPSNLFAGGSGQAVKLAAIRGFPLGTRTPEMFEIRVRTYGKHWQDAVDPHVAWMEREAGFAPVGEKHHPAWVKDIKNQVYIQPGDYAKLEEMAKRADASKTFIGREASYRYHSFDVNYTDYRVAEKAKKWLKRARELGFHVGAHFNSKSISTSFPELIKRFRPGFRVTGTDADGNETYESIQGGTLVRCSAAYKPWRDHLIEQMRDAVESGFDVIYLDESMGPAGKFIVDGVNGIEGLMLLMKETAAVYPDVAIELEQFNPMSARYASFALSQMPLGHPLSGYIFHRFIKIVPEGYMSGPTDDPMMDAHASWGFMVPGGTMEESWMRIVKAFQDHDLVPDSRLPCKRFTRYDRHFSGGWFPVCDDPIPPAGYKLFGYRGVGGVTAYFEKHAQKRGLVVYEPGKPPKWIGTRARGVIEWSGPGMVLEWMPGVSVYSADWLLYDGQTMLGLDPKKTYLVDEKAALPQDRFHVTAIPDDFAHHVNPATAAQSQELGTTSSWFKLTFSGHGQVAMSVPDDGCMVYLNGVAVPIDRRARTASVRVDADPEKPAVLLAYVPSDAVLKGKWVDLPWDRPKYMRTWMLSAATDAKDAESFFNNVCGHAVILGRFPKARSIRLRGTYGMRSPPAKTPGDGVVRINGKEGLRVPAGKQPFQVHDFDVDISAFAGKHVLFEFGSEGEFRFAPADWDRPRIVVVGEP